MSQSIIYETDGAVATVTLNRPERLNAMNRELIDAAVATLERAASDAAIRVLILTGAGRGFCAGADMSMLSDVCMAFEFTSYARWATIMLTISSTTLTFDISRKPWCVFAMPSIPG